jgi:adenylate cyclase
MLRERPDVNNDTATKREPTAAEIREQLERVLGSQCFEQAGRSSKFLRFAAEQTLAGIGERLKGYTIAVEVFGRPADFDAQNDPLVRVEAGRLRRRLAEYYAGEGKRDELRVDLPRGGYAVVWSYVSAEEPPVLLASASAPDGPTPAAGAVPPKRRRRLRAWVIAALLVALSALVVVQQLRLSSRADRDFPTLTEALARSGKPPIVVLPFEDLSAQSELRGLADALTEETLLSLNEPELFTVATEPGAGAALGAGSSRVVIPVNIPAAYLLNGSVRDGVDGVRITARVMATSTGTQLWNVAYDEPNGIKRSSADQERVAHKIAAVAEPYGPLFDVENERVQRLPDDVLSTRDCVLKYYDYRRRLDGASHESTLKCFERTTKMANAQATAWAGLALLLADRHAYGYGAPPTNGTAALDRAREAARTALDIDGDNVLANLALAQVQFFSGEDFRRTGERALALRPDRAQTLAALGTLYVFAGEPERGLPMVDRSIELTAKPPGWVYATRALADLREQRFAEAVAAALKIDAPNWPLGELIVAASAALAGRADLADRARGRLLNLDPRAEDTLPALLERWRVDPMVRDELERGLGAAGARTQ